jgi:hypothetical protein
LPGRIAARLDEAEASLHPKQRLLVDVIAEAVEASVAPHLIRIRRR